MLCHLRPRVLVVTSRPMITILASLALAAQEPARHPCEIVGDMTAGMMQSRQSDVPMSKVRASIQRIFGKGEPWVYQIMMDALMDAYERPSYYTPESKAEEVNRFRNDWELECFKRIEAR